MKEYTKEELISQIVDVYSTESKDILLERLTCILHTLPKLDIETMWVEMI